MGPGYGEEKAYRPREWSTRKLAYLRAYLEAYLRATSSALQRYYIDCFAGRGTWRTEDGQEFKGSPLQAIEAQEAAGVLFTQLHFIERLPRYAEALRSIATGLPNVVVHNNDANTIVGSILRKIHPKAPVFVMLDPTSAHHVKWTTMQMLASRKTELFINYSYSLRRMIGVPSLWPHIDTFFGTDEWRAYRLHPERDARLFELYKSRLRDIGYRYIHRSEIIRNTRNVPLYYMVWAGKNEIGERIMASVLKRLRFQGQLFNELD